MSVTRVHLCQFDRWLCQCEGEFQAGRCKMVGNLTRELLFNICRQRLSCQNVLSYECDLLKLSCLVVYILLMLFDSVRLHGLGTTHHH